MEKAKKTPNLAVTASKRKRSVSGESKSSSREGSLSSKRSRNASGDSSKSETERTICSQCGESFDQSEFRRHNRIPHDWPCDQPECDFMLESEQALINHKKKIHAILPAGSNTSSWFWKCEACNKSFNNKTITDHKSTPHNYNCHHCTLLFVTEIELDTHLKSFHKITPGLDKSVALTSKSLKKLNTPEQLPFTDIAKSSLSSKAVSINIPKLSGNLSKKKDNMTARSSPCKPSSPDKLGEAYWKCPLCLDVFNKENKLSVHTDKEHNNKCDECSHTFVALSSFMRHSVKVHSIEVRSTDICEECGEVIDKKSMAGHKRRAHLVPCEDCSLHFLSPAELWKHKIKEHNWGNQMNSVKLGNKSGKVKDVKIKAKSSPIRKGNLMMQPKVQPSKVKQDLKMNRNDKVVKTKEITKINLKVKPAESNKDIKINSRKSIVKTGGITKINLKVKPSQTKDDTSKMSKVKPTEIDSEHEPKKKRGRKSVEKDKAQSDEFSTLNTASASAVWKEELDVSANSQDKSPEKESLSQSLFENDLEEGAVRIKDVKVFVDPDSLVKCLFCALPMKQGKLEKHNSRGHNYSCGDCCLTYVTQKGLEEHNFLVHGLNPGGLLKCEECDEVFEDKLKNSYLNHMKNAKHLSCEKCERKFSSGQKDIFQYHQEHDHSSSTDLVCSLCQTAYLPTDKIKYSQHMATDHEVGPCPHCMVWSGGPVSVRFVSVDRFINHHKARHSEEGCDCLSGSETIKRELLMKNEDAFDLTELQITDDNEDEDCFPEMINKDEYEFVDDDEIELNDQNMVEEGKVEIKEETKHENNLNISEEVLGDMEVLHVKRERKVRTYTHRDNEKYTNCMDIQDNAISTTSGPGPFELDEDSQMSVEDIGISSSDIDLASGPSVTGRQSIKHINEVPTEFKDESTEEDTNSILEEPVVVLKVVPAEGNMTSNFEPNNDKVIWPEPISKTTEEILLEEAQSFQSNELVGGDLVDIIEYSPPIQHLTIKKEIRLVLNENCKDPTKITRTSENSSICSGGDKLSFGDSKLSSENSLSINDQILSSGDSKLSSEISTSNDDHTLSSGDSKVTSDTLVHQPGPIFGGRISPFLDEEIEPSEAEINRAFRRVEKKGMNVGVRKTKSEIATDTGVDGRFPDNNIGVVGIVEKPVDSMKPFNKQFTPSRTRLSVVEVEEDKITRSPQLEKFLLQGPLITPERFLSKQRISPVMSVNYSDNVFGVVPSTIKQKVMNNDVPTVPQFDQVNDSLKVVLPNSKEKSPMDINSFVRVKGTDDSVFLEDQKPHGVSSILSICPTECVRRTPPGPSLPLTTSLPIVAPLLIAPKVAILPPPCKVTPLSIAPKVAPAPIAPKGATLPLAPKVATLPIAPKVATQQLAPKAAPMSFPLKEVPLPLTPHVASLPLHPHETPLPPLPKVASMPLSSYVAPLPLPSHVASRLPPLPPDMTPPSLPENPLLSSPQGISVQCSTVHVSNTQHAHTPVVGVTGDQVFRRQGRESKRKPPKVLMNEDNIDDSFESPSTSYQRSPIYNPVSTSDSPHISHISGHLQTVTRAPVIHVTPAADNPFAIMLNKAFESKHGAGVVERDMIIKSKENSTEKGAAGTKLEDIKCEMEKVQMEIEEMDIDMGLGLLFRNRCDDSQGSNEESLDGIKALLESQVSSRMDVFDDQLHQEETTKQNNSNDSVVSIEDSDDGIFSPNKSKEADEEIYVVDSDELEPEVDKSPIKSPGRVVADWQTLFNTKQSPHTSIVLPDSKSLFTDTSPNKLVPKDTKFTVKSSSISPPGKSSTTSCSNTRKPTLISPNKSPRQSDLFADFFSPDGKVKISQSTSSESQKNKSYDDVDDLLGDTDDDEEEEDDKNYIPITPVKSTSINESPKPSPVLSTPKPSPVLSTPKPSPVISTPKSRPPPVIKPVMLSEQQTKKRPPPQYECPECGQLYGRGIVKEREYNTHIRQEHNFPCPFCPKRFTFINGLEEHKNTVHIRETAESNLASFLCNLCNKSFSRQGPFEKHQKREHNVSCTECNMQFTNEPFLVEHLSQDHGINPQPTFNFSGPVKVTKLSSPVSVKFKLANGIINDSPPKDVSFKTKAVEVPKGITVNVDASEDDTVCAQCGQSFDLLENFEKHIELDHDHQCEVEDCDLSFVHSYYLSLHTYLVHGQGCRPDDRDKPIEEIKLVTIIDLEKMDTSIDDDEIGLADLVVSEDYLPPNTSSALRSYRIPKKLGPSLGGIKNSDYRTLSCDETLTCYECRGQATFNNRDAFDAHIETQHNSYSGIKSVPGGSKDKDFTCFQCNLQFSTRSELDVHVKDHYSPARVISSTLSSNSPSSSVGPKLKCPLCTEYFQQMTTMMEHLKRQHYSGRAEKQNSFWCQLCRKGFETMRKLIDHEKILHKYPCSHCHKAYILEVDLNHHVERNHKSLIMSTQAREGFTCRLCGATFREMETFKMHQSTPHSICCYITGCERRYQTKELLIIHLNNEHHVVQIKIGAEEESRVSLTTERSQENKDIAKWAESWINSQLAVDHMVKVLKRQVKSRRHDLFLDKRERDHCSGSETSRLYQLSNPGFLGGGGEKDTTVIKHLIDRVFLTNFSESDPRLQQLGPANTAFVYTSCVLFPETFIHQHQVQGKSREEAERAFMEVAVDVEERRGLSQEIKEAAVRNKRDQSGDSGDEWVDHSDISDDDED